MRRIIRTRRLTPAEAAKYKAIREQIAQELPALIRRHHERMRRSAPPSDSGAEKRNP